MATTVEVVEKFTKKTVPQLKAYAKKHNIDLYGTNTKEEMLRLNDCGVDGIISDYPDRLKEIFIN